MRIRMLALALVTATAVQPLAGQVPQGSARDPARDRVPQRHIRSTTLDNGLEVIVAPNAAIPMVTLQLVVRAGAVTQSREEEEGIPHLMEHILFRSGDFSDRAGKIDASWNGVTSSESVRYYLTFPSAHLEDGLKVLSDLVRKPRFSKDAIEAERKVVQGELERRASDPMGLLFTESEMLTWPGEAWRAKNPGGNLFSLNSARPDMLQDLYDRYYLPNNSALIIAGDLVDTATMAMADRIFRGWKRGDPVKAAAPPIGPLDGIKRKAFAGDVRDVTIMVRWHGPDAGADRASTYAADVFAGLVNQPVSATQLRLVDSGILEDVGMSYETSRYVGPVTLTATASADKAVEAVEALGKELPRLFQPDYFTDDDLALAQTRQRVAAQYRLESATTTSHLLADFWTSAGSDYYAGYADSLQSRTRADVQAYVDRFLKGKPFTVVVIVPRDTWKTSSTRIQRALGAWRIP